MCTSCSGILRICGASGEVGGLEEDGAVVAACAADEPGAVAESGMYPLGGDGDGEGVTDPQEASEADFLLLGHIVTGSPGRERADRGLVCRPLRQAAWRLKRAG